MAENFDYDWKTADREFQRAIELDPGYATGRQWYAEYLSWQGRFDDALAESDRVQRLDPLSLIIATDRGTILYYARQYDRAIAECRAVLSMEPRFDLARAFAFLAFVKEAKFPEALEEIEGGRSIGDSPVGWADKAYLYGQWGRTTQSRHASVRFEQFAPQLRDRTQASIVAYIGTGRKDDAIALLQKAYAEHSNIVTSLKVDPRYDPLRDNPKFQELVRALWPTQ